MVKIAKPVKTTQDDFEAHGHALLLEHLREIQRISVTDSSEPETRNGYAPDFTVEIDGNGQHQILFAEVARNAEPRQALNAIYRLKEYCSSVQRATGLLLAPYISPEAAKLCRDRRIGYLDFAGNCHLEFNGIYLHVEGKPNPLPASRTLRSLYHPKSERILRVLLSHPERLWRLQALADEANVSIGQVYKVKELLLKNNWLTETDAGATVVHPAEIVTAWSQNYRTQKHAHTQMYTLMPLPQFERSLSEYCDKNGIDCAFTSFAAAERYAPHAQYLRTTAYVADDLALAMDELNLTSVETGANVTLLSPYDAGVFYASRYTTGVRIVSPVQAYLDLQQTGGRGDEAAALILDKEILHLR